MGYKIYVGDRVEAQLTIKDILQLEYKNVKNGLMLSPSEKACSHEVYDTCIYTKIANLMKNETEDHCTVPWIVDNNRICSKPSDINKTFWTAWDRITNQRKDCEIPCHTILVNVGAVNRKMYHDRNYSQLYLYFSSRVIKSEEHYVYTIIKLMAQIGGYISLCRLALWFLDLCKFSKLREENNKTTPSSNEDENDDTEDLRKPPMDGVLALATSVVFL